MSKPFDVYPTPTHWKVDGVFQGKRIRRFFKKKADAKSWCDAKNTELEAYGETAALPDSLRIQAIEASRILQPVGATVVEAAEYFVKRHHIAGRSVFMQHLCEDVENSVAAKVLKGEVSKDHLQGIRKVSRALVPRFKDCMVCDIRKHEIVVWLESYVDLSPTTRDYYRRYATVIFSYAVSRGYTDENPAHGIPSMAKKGEIRILNWWEVSALLHACHPSMIPFYALGVFAGLRPMSELLRLTWDKIDWDDLTIDIENIKTAGHSNSARSRHVSMSNNLLLWIQPSWFLCMDPKARVVPANWRDHVYGSRKGREVKFPTDREKAILKCNLECPNLTDWPMDAMRHTYASWHYSIGQDAGKTAASMGHSNSQTIFRNYNRKIKPEEAKKYLEIYP